MKDKIATETIIHTLLIDKNTNYMLSAMANTLTSSNRKKMVGIIISSLNRRDPVYSTLVKIIGTVVLTGMTSNRTTRKRLDLEMSLLITSYIIQEPDQRKTSAFLRTVVTHLCTLDKLKMIKGLLFFRPLLKEEIKDRVTNYLWEETLLDVDFYSLLCDGSFVETGNENDGIYYYGRDGDIDATLRVMSVYQPNRKRKRGLKYDYQDQQWIMKKHEKVHFVTRRESPNYVRLMTMLLCVKKNKIGNRISQFLGNCVSDMLGDVRVTFHERPDTK